MLVTLIVTPLYDFACMGLVLLFRGVSKKANIVMNIKVEERSRLSTSLVNDKVIEGMMLVRIRQNEKKSLENHYMWYDQILLNEE
jgi:hypothetical protein